MEKTQRTFTDQLGREVKIDFPPRRIVSLVPSQTELLYELGLEDEVIGITKFCIHPDEWFRTKTRIGGTKKLKLDIIRNLQPDLIIANKEENTQEEIEVLSREFPVWISDIKSLKEASAMIKSVGAIANRETGANKLAEQIKDSFRELCPSGITPSILYLIWKNPYMAAGRDTFIQAMITACGFKNVIVENASRYPELTVQKIKQLNPDAILLSSEPFPFKGKHTDEVKSQFPDSKVIEVDGELFSWYGSRLLHAPPYFKSLRKKVQTSL